MNGTPSQGFFYISFGTVAKGPNLPLEIRNKIFKTIESFPKLRFIWRWDGPNPDDYPKNLLFQKWVEQEDLLGGYMHIINFGAIPILILSLTFYTILTRPSQN